MADAPEIPEANDPFEKRVAVTIALIAIVLSFIQNAGDKTLDLTQSVLDALQSAP